MASSTGDVCITLNAAGVALLASCWIPAQVACNSLFEYERLFGMRR